MYFWQSAMKSTKKEKLLRLQPSTVMRTKVSSLISSLRKTDFSTTRLYGLTDLMYRNGRSKELNVEGHGLNRQNVKAKNTLTNLIKIEIFFHLVNLSRWDTTAKDGTGKQ